MQKEVVQSYVAGVDRCVTQVLIASSVRPSLPARRSVSPLTASPRSRLNSVVTGKASDPRLGAMNTDESSAPIPGATTFASQTSACASLAIALTCWSTIDAGERSTYQRDDLQNRPDDFLSAKCQLHFLISKVK